MLVSIQRPLGYGPSTLPLRQFANPIERIEFPSPAEKAGILPLNDIGICFIHDSFCHKILKFCCTYHFMRNRFNFPAPADPASGTEENRTLLALKISQNLSWVCSIYYLIYLCEESNLFACALVLETSPLPVGVHRLILVYYIYYIYYI